MQKKSAQTKIQADLNLWHFSQEDVVICLLHSNYPPNHKIHRIVYAFDER